MAFDPDAYLGTTTEEFDPDAYLTTDTTLPEVVATQSEGLSDRIKKFLFDPEGAKTLREGIQGAVQSIPQMAVDTAKMGYKGLRMAMGGPEERARIVAEALAQAKGQGEQTSADIQSPFGTPEWLRGATQLGMMATPGLELARELRATVEIPREVPPVEPPPVQVPVEPTLTERITQPRVEPAVEEPLAPVTPEVSPAQPKPITGETFKSKTEADARIAQLLDTVNASPKMMELMNRHGLTLDQLYATQKIGNKWGVVITDEHRAATAKENAPALEGPTAAPEIPATAPEAVMPSPVAEVAPPVSPGALKRLAQLKAHKAQVEGINGQVHPDVEKRIAALEEKVNPNRPGAVRPRAEYQTYNPDWFKTEAPSVETPAASTKPDWVNQQIDAISAPLEANGVANQIEALAAQRLTAKQIAQKLGLEPEQVSAVRAKRGIPSMEDRPGFEAWVKSRGQPPEGPVQAQEAPPIASEAPGGVPVAEPAPATPQLEIPPEDVKYAGGEPVTSTKNVVTAAEREARGLPPAEEAAARDFGTVWDESAKDTVAPARLVAALKVEPRALSDVENAHLLRRQIELQTEHDSMTKAVNEATDPAVAAEAKQRLETVRNDLQDVYDVGKAAGTETGRGLNARKMLADQDYALANMEATTRALVNDGKPLSEAQLSEVAKLHERIRTAEDKLAAYESQEIFNQSLKAAPRRPVLSFLDEQAVKARERINARRTRLYADPLGVTNVAHLADEAIIGASHIARGVTKFADWSAQMVSEFGDRIKPYLAALFEKSKQQFKNASAGLKKAPVTYAEREARALAGEKKGIITRTEKLIGRTEVVTAGHPFGEFEPLKRRAPRMDPEKARLQYQYSKAKEAFDRGIYEAELKKRSVPERILGTAREVLNLPRSLLASADLSAVRRQGGIYTMIHPLHARHAFRAMLEATKSEQGYFKVTQEIKDRPNAPEYQRYGLELTDIGPVTRAKMEEQFQSRWAGKIPGISHSQRAYTAFLNRARADWFDLLKDSLAKKGEPLTPKQGKAIANAVNVFTGRGAMNQKWIGAMTALNDVFFAPRWRASRFQTLIGQPLWKNSGARGVIAKEYAKALIGYGSILTLIGWATRNTLHPMEKNPVSTEAGKLRIGNTRVDFLQGLQQPTVLLSRLFSGRTKTAAGEVQKIYGDVPLGKTTSSDIITRFMRSSLAPVPSGVWNVLEQKNVIGEPVTLPSTVRDLTIPLLGKDVYDAMKEQGVPTGTALGLLALFGDGIQTYSPRVNNTQSATSKKIQKALGGGVKHQKSVSEQIKAALEKP